MPAPKTTSFTLKSNAGLFRNLVTDVEIFIANTQLKFRIQGIWDTGATGSTVTSNVVKKLGLQPTGMAQVHTANGIANQKTYTVDIGLLNGVLIQGVTVTEVDALSGGCDALIGMDIITIGDFSITNHEGKSCFTFRFPSSHELDYVKNPNMGIKPDKYIPAGRQGSKFTLPKKKKKR